jgi:hypothetical protein
MFLALLCLGLWVLLAQKVPFDIYGWMMVIASAWFCGFLDGRLFAHFDQRQHAHSPTPDAEDPQV